MISPCFAADILEEGSSRSRELGLSRCWADRFCSFRFFLSFRKLISFLFCSPHRRKVKDFKLKNNVTIFLLSKTIFFKKCESQGGVDRIRPVRIQAACVCKKQA